MLLNSKYCVRALPRIKEMYVCNIAKTKPNAMYLFPHKTKSASN